MSFVFLLYLSDFTQPPLSLKKKKFTVGFMTPLHVQSFSLLWLSSHLLRFFSKLWQFSLIPTVPITPPLSSSCCIAVAFKSSIQSLVFHSVERLCSILHGATRIICVEHIDDQVIFLLRDFSGSLMHTKSRSNPVKALSPSTGPQIISVLISYLLSPSYSSSPWRQLVLEWILLCSFLLECFYICSSEAQLKFCFLHKALQDSSVFL